MATGLLALKIWMMTRTRHVTSGGGYRLHRSVRLAGHVIAVIVESGLIYLATQLVLVVLVSIKHPAEAIVGVIAVQVYVSTLCPWLTICPLIYQLGAPGHRSYVDCH